MLAVEPCARVALVLAAAAVSAGCGRPDSDLFGDIIGATSTSAGTQGGGDGSGAAGGGGSGAAGGGGSGAAGGGGSGAAGGGAGGDPAGSGGAGGSGCDEIAWYCDADSDAHGDRNAVVEACNAPPGGDEACAGPYVTSSDDCGPNEATAHPGAEAYHAEPMAPPAHGGSTFDYNCDGAATPDPEQLFDGTGTLDCNALDCLGSDPPEGYGVDAECGATSEYYRCEQSFGQRCGPIAAEAPEPLRCR
ncbi:hypothetical protein [Sorangium sp. So ce131]|uniref:hypothetical protein n=1 Tax=Sorangium sp. So ce131 TaxID=3133282 RepID=UPI003F5D9AC5